MNRCPVSLDDRSRLMSGESSSEPVFALIREEFKQIHPITSPFRTRFNKNETSPPHHASHSFAPDIIPSTQTAFQPCFVTSGDKSSSIKANRQTNLENQSFLQRKSFNSNPVELVPSRSMSIPKSSDSWSAQFNPDALNQGSCFSENKDENASFEIDCSQSEVQFRFIKRKRSKDFRQATSASRKVGKFV